MITAQNIAEEEKDEAANLVTENDVTIEVDTGQATPPNQLRYLKIFSETELEELQDDFKRPLSELEETLAKHWMRRLSYRVENILANATNLLYIFFLSNTSHEGVENFIKFFNNEIFLSSWLSYSIGITFAVLSTLLNMLTFSPEKESYKSTLKSVYAKSLKEKIQAYYYDLLSSPQMSFLNGTICLINIAVLLCTNLTAGMINIIDLADKINIFPAPLYWLIVVTILYFSQKDYGNYMNSNYRNGSVFWRDKSLPWLVKEIQDGQIAIPLQIIGQSASSIGLRLLIFYYLAEASSKVLGFWFPTPMVIALAMLHSFRTLYPGTYHFYLDDEIKIKSKFEEKKVDGALTFKNYMFEKKKSSLSEYGQFYLFTVEPMIILSIVISATVAGWLGWQTGALIDQTLIVPIMLAVLMSITIGGLFYQAEANRVMRKLILSQENKANQNDEKNEKLEQTICEFIFDKAASFINIVSSGSVIMSNVGILGRSFNDSRDSTFFTPICIFLAFLRGLNMLRFNGPKVHNTMNSLVPERFSSRLPTQSRFFAASPKKILASPECIEAKNKDIYPQFAVK